jgi:hypothetical protein
VNRIRSGAGSSRQQPRISAPDPALTPNAGLAVITELCGRLGVIGALDTAVGPIKQRDRGFGAGELLAGIAAAQLAGEDFLTGLDRQRADAAGQQVMPIPELARAGAIYAYSFILTNPPRRLWSVPGRWHGAGRWSAPMPRPYPWPGQTGRRSAIPR